MDYASEEVVYGRTFLSSILAAFSTRPAAALVVTPKVRLSSDINFNPTPDNTVATLAANEATFSGYTAGGIAPTFSAVLRGGPDFQQLNAPVLFEAATADPFVPGNCYGWWLDDGTNVIAAEKFANGLVASFANVGDYLALDVYLPMHSVQANS